ncbi:MAG: hypothetical protein ABH823_05315 [bacterium]
MDASVTQVCDTSYGPKGETLRLFNSNQPLKTAVDFLLGLLAADVESERPLTCYKSLAVLKKLSVAEKARLVRYIVENYDIQSRLPLGKLRELGEIKDEIAAFVLFYKLKEITKPEQLLVLLCSIVGEREKPKITWRNGNGSICLHHNMRQLLAEAERTRQLLEQRQAQYTLEDNGDEVVVSRNGVAITFELDEEITATAPTRLKLYDVYDLVVEINRLSQEDQILDVKVHQSSSGYFDPADNTIAIPIDENYLTLACHEMGHAVWNGASSPKGVFRMLFIVAKELDCFSLFRDSLYNTTNSMLVGHPQDALTELFASATLLYRLHPDQFLANIKDPGLDKKVKILGMTVYLMMKHLVFQGQEFANSPLTEGDLAEFRGLARACLEEIDESTPEEMVDLLMTALYLAKRESGRGEEFLLDQLHNPLTRLSAMKVINRFEISDDRLIGHLLLLANSCVDRFNCKQLAFAMGRLKHDCFVVPLISLFQRIDKYEGNNWYLVVTIIRALGELRDNRALPALKEFAPYAEDDIVQKVLEETIGKIEEAQ